MSDLTTRITEILMDPIQGNGLDRFHLNLNGARLSRSTAAHVAALIAAAAEQHYRPRVETVEQLDALPVGVVLVSEDPADLHVIGDFGPVNLAVPSNSPERHAPIDLPAVVLWSPGAGA